LEKAKSGLADLQDLEIAQNRQRNVWMGLKKCLDGLEEMFGWAWRKKERFGKSFAKSLENKQFAGERQA
jgi:hypothetical protein